MEASGTSSPLRSVPMTVLKPGLLRAAVALVIMWGMALAQHLTNEPTGARSTFIVGVIVAAVAGFSVIYDIESWSVLKQSLIHTGCMAVIVVPCLFLSGWFPVDGPQDVFVILGYFAVAGVAIWSVGYLIFGILLNRPERRPHRDAS